MRYRRACLSALVALGAAGVSANAPAVAQAPSNGLAQRQAQIREILTRMPLDRVLSRREFCASGIQAEMLAAVDRAVGDAVPYQLADECLAYITRAAREGRLEPIRSDRAPAAAALDAGFATGFGQGGPIPAGLPSMAALKPVAERCLGQREANLRLCSATGFALGLRASHSEIVRAG